MRLLLAAVLCTVFSMDASVFSRSTATSYWKSASNTSIPITSPTSRNKTRAVATSEAKAVFAHYMVGSVTQEHAHQDIDDAKAMGLDGFALNVGDPTPSWVQDTLHDLLGYAEYVGGFKLYISMDVYASGAACHSSKTPRNRPYDYQDIFTLALSSSAYYLGPNGFPLISTFSSGGLIDDTWIAWRKNVGEPNVFYSRL